MRCTASACMYRYIHDFFFNVSSNVAIDALPVVLHVAEKITCSVYIYGYTFLYINGGHASGP